MTKISIKLLLFVFIFSPVSLYAQSLQIKVTSVHDGDTLNAIGVADSQKYKVRLMGVDTPEVDFYKNTQGAVALKARDVLRSLIPEGSIVTLSDDSQVDKHGRVLGRLIKDGLDVNKEMLKQGWGVIYFIYPFEKRIASDYSQAAKEAFDNKRGIFSNQYRGTEIPYQFRLRVRDQVGRNPVGDLELKKVVSPDDVEKIPVWKRVFFPDYELAYKNGYN
ncbi:thermonuclease family protein [Bdellovibrio bacteriovorus]|uniref:thermonuclease family protein n=1 Tax=Bdellovibrio bacteriovorus TaxID=959 RepID=UPI0035A70EE1